MNAYKWRLGIFVWVYNDNGELIESRNGRNYHYKKLFKKLYYLCCISPIGDDDGEGN